MISERAFGDLGRMSHLNWFGTLERRNIKSGNNSKEREKTNNLPKYGIIKLYDWLDDLSMFIDSLRDVDGGKQRCDEEPDGGIYEVHSWASSVM